MARTKTTARRTTRDYNVNNEYLKKLRYHNERVALSRQNLFSSEPIEESLKIKEIRSHLLNITNQRHPESLQSYLIHLANIHLQSYETMNSTKRIFPAHYLSPNSQRQYLNAQEQLERVNRERTEQEGNDLDPVVVPMGVKIGEEDDGNAESGPVNKENNKEIPKELPESEEFLKMVDAYICDREAVDRNLADELGFRINPDLDIGKGIEEIMFQGEILDEEEFFKSCLDHAKEVLDWLERPEFDIEGKKEEEKNDKEVKTLNDLVTVFEYLWQKEGKTLEELINILVYSLLLLRLNYFWRELRSFMTDIGNGGLAYLISGLVSEERSQIIIEGVCEIIYDLNFSCRNMKELNKFFFEELSEHILLIFKRDKWLSLEYFEYISEVIMDIILGNWIEEKVPASITPPSIITENTAFEEYTVKIPELYYNNSHDFQYFVYMVFHLLLSTDYKVSRGRKSVDDLIEDEEDEEWSPEDEELEEGDEISEEGMGNDEIEEDRNEDKIGEEYVDSDWSEEEDKEKENDIIKNPLFLSIILEFINLYSTMFQIYPQNYLHDEINQYTHLPLKKPINFVLNSRLNFTNLSEGLQKILGPGKKISDYERIDYYHSSFMGSGGEHATLILSRIKQSNFKNLSIEEQYNLIMNSEASTFYNSGIIENISPGFISKIFKDTIKVNQEKHELIALEDLARLLIQYRPNIEELEEGVITEEEISLRKNFYNEIVETLIEKFRDEFFDLNKLTTILSNFISRFCDMVKIASDPLNTQDINLMKLTSEDFIQYNINRNLKIITLNFDDIERGELKYKFTLPTDALFEHRTAFFVYAHNAIGFIINKLEPVDAQQEEDDQREIQNLRGEMDVEDDVDDLARISGILRRDQIRNQDNIEENEMETPIAYESNPYYYTYTSVGRKSEELVQQIKKKIERKAPIVDYIRKGHAVFQIKISAEGAWGGRGLFGGDRRRIAGIPGIGGNRVVSYHINYPVLQTPESSFNKFWDYVHTSLDNAGQGLFGGGNVENEFSHRCLYTKRMKKVIMRCKGTFPPNIGNITNMLKIEKIDVKKEYDLENIEECDDIFDHVIKFNTIYRVKDTVSDYIEPSNSMYIAEKESEARCIGFDYTTRSTILIKFKLKSISESYGVLIKFSDDEIHYQDEMTNIKKIFRRKNTSKNIEKIVKYGYVYPVGETTIIAGKVVACRRTPESFLEQFNGGQDSHINEYLDLRIWFRKKIERRFGFGLQNHDYLNFSKVSEFNVDGAFNSYVEYGNNLGQKIEPYLYFSRVSDAEKVYRMKLDKGSSVCIHDVYRKVYILKERKGKIELRMLPFYAFKHHILSDEQLEIIES